MADDVLFDKRPDGVGLITLNRPDSLNAMGGQMIPLLSRVLAQCAHDPAVRAVILTGAGRAFCAGGDVKGMARGPVGGIGGLGDAAGDAGDAGGGAAGPTGSIATALEQAAAGLRARQMEISYVLHTMPKPTIAMVNGHAVGAGLSVALACDLRIASDKAKFSTVFRNVAMSGDFGGSFYLTRLVGSGKARELYFTAEMLDAEGALRIGMVNRVVHHDQLESETMALAAKLAAGPTAAYARMKENLNLAEQSDLRTLLDQEGFNMVLTGMSNDSREAVRAFVEKREPKFSGS
jgi:2-(1,2-epoxy-1,2-dihydrophenyl)acetyl-CoA isomerase